MENTTIQDQLKPVLDAERDINNAVNWVGGRGKPIPSEIRDGKIAHAKRMLANGASLNQVMKAIHVTQMTLQAWRAKYGFADKLANGRRVRIPYTFLSREERARGAANADPVRSAAGRKGAEARWGSRKDKEVKHYNRKRGYHRNTYTVAEKMLIAKRARILLKNKSAINWSHAARQLRVSPGALNKWLKGDFGMNLRTPRVPNVIVSVADRYTVSIDVAKSALGEILSEVKTVNPEQIRSMVLAYENRLLRKLIGG